MKYLDDEEGQSSELRSAAGLSRLTVAEVSVSVTVSVSVSVGIGVGDDGVHGERLPDGGDQ